MAVIAGFTARDALVLLTPGQVFEAFQIRAEQKGMKRRDEL